MAEAKKTGFSNFMKFLLVAVAVLGYLAFTKNQELDELQHKYYRCSYERYVLAKKIEGTPVEETVKIVDLGKILTEPRYASAHNWGMRQAEEKKAEEERQQEAKMRDPARLLRVARIRSEYAIKRLAHNPNSIMNVSAISPLQTTTLQGYPSCKYTLLVQFRGTNAFGAAVLNRARVYFDKSLTVLTVMRE